MVVLTAIFLLVASVILIGVAFVNQRKSHLNWYDFDREFARGQAHSDLQQLKSAVQKSLVIEHDPKPLSGNEDNLPVVVAQNQQTQSEVLEVLERLDQSVHKIAAAGETMSSESKSPASRTERLRDIRDWCMAGFGIAGLTISGETLVGVMLDLWGLGVFP